MIFHQLSGTINQTLDALRRLLTLVHTRVFLHKVFGMKDTKCAACGINSNLHYHHLVPRADGGGDEEINIITLCGSCHAKIHRVSANWTQSSLVKKALAKKKEAGEMVNGSPPYGYTVSFDGKTLVRCEREQKIIRKAKELSEQGLSYRKISDTLKTCGLTARNGKPFQATQIMRLIA